MFKKYLNSTLALSQASSSGSIVESYVYDAYGNVTIRNGSGTVIPTSAYGNRFLFQGREYDYTTQLYHFRARRYDPETGRWLSNDPIGISGGLNLYAFCSNDPVNFVDPSGLAILQNGTDKPIIVSGGLGFGNGHGFSPNVYYSIILPGEVGGGRYHPLATFSSFSVTQRIKDEFFNNRNSMIQKLPAPSASLYDIDCYYNPDTKSWEKIYGTDFGPTFVVRTDRQGKVFHLDVPKWMGYQDLVIDTVNHIIYLYPYELIVYPETKFPQIIP